MFAENVPERPGSRDWAQFARLARFVLPYRGRVAAAIAALLVAAGCVLAFGQGLRHVIDTGFASADAGVLDRSVMRIRRSHGRRLHAQRGFLRPSKSVGARRTSPRR